ncbi:hypothetical protein GGI20_000046 [Coemansia sp. BCRC 34301]|nr:hypothetical protein GGI20_000046 [Coemansia sp. BCRC 34301]
MAALAPTTTTTGSSVLLPAVDEVLNCQLVGPFSIAVQVLVGSLGFSTLIIKRHVERPRRPWLVWYVLNLTLDCTIGILFITGYLKLFGYLAQRLNVKGLESGHYGDPPSWKRWIKQASIFCASMVCMKLTVVLLITLLPLLVGLGDLILKPIQLTHSPRFEIVFVMAIWPLSLNIFESWVIDQFIKKRRKPGNASANGHIPLATSDMDQGGSSFELANALYPPSSPSSLDSRTLGGHSAEDTRLSIEMSEFEVIDDDGDDMDKRQLPLVLPGDAQAIRLTSSSPSDQSALLPPGKANTKN